VLRDEHDSSGDEPSVDRFDVVLEFNEIGSHRGQDPTAGALTRPSEREGERDERSSPLLD
jgi:hypothetical protein